MDQRRQERERIGLIGVMQVWGKSPPRSEELVLTMILLYRSLGIKTCVVYSVTNQLHDSFVI
jgi:hypothetical protein